MGKSNRINFTPARLARITPPAAGRTMVYDAEVPGLAYRLAASGAAAWYFYRWVGGRPVKMKIGDARAMLLADARQAARKLAASAADGIIPKRAGGTGGQATVGEVWTTYLATAKLRKKSWAEDERRWGKFWAAFATRRLAAVPRAALLAVYDRIGAEAPYEANRAWSVIRAVYNYAADELGYDGVNPAFRLPKARRFKEQANERYLRPDELPAFFDALDGYEHQKLTDFFKLLLYTGARRRNAEAARWEHVNLAAKTWTLPDTKSGRAVVVPLTDDALAVLMRRRAAVPDSCEWVFPGRVGEGHLVEPMMAWRAILKVAKITERTRIHDLRHSLATYMGEAGAVEGVIADALGHTGKGTVTARYTHVRLDTIRAAVGKAIDLIHRHANRLGVGLSAKLVAGKARGR